VVGVDIYKDATLVTNWTSTVIVGQHIALTGMVTPGDLEITSEQWTIPGDRIKNYIVQNPDTGMVVELPEADLHSNGVDFYWVDGDYNLTVTYAVTIGGHVYSGHTNFIVLRPDAALSATLTSNNPKVDVGFIAPGGDALHFGTFDRADTMGITWSTASVTAPLGGDGEIALFQLIKPNEVATTDYNEDVYSSKDRQGCPSDFVLDDPVPYVNITTPIAGGGSASVGDPTYHQPLNDTPCVWLRNRYNYVTVHDTFETYLMYKPDGGIWVTLRMMTWHWGGAASKDSQNVWSLVNGSQDAAADPSVNSVDQPQWFDYYHNYDWYPARH